MSHNTPIPPQRVAVVGLLIAAFIGCLLSSCARQGTLTGGPEDKDAPILDTLRSTPNYQTRFSGRYIELGFDEWLVLKNPAQQVVISPPLAKNPKVTLDGKVVKVDLGENAQLRPNTTYTINFGDAVADFHKDNVVKGLRYVFSTGDVLDSLELRGTVYDGFSGEPVENVTVALYDVLTDSVPIKEKPYYFARTDKNGLYKIQNIRSGQFKIVGIDEGTASDLRWNGGGEGIAYQDSLVSITDSTQNQQVRLKVFKTELPFKLTDRAVGRYGLARLAYSRTPSKQTLIRPLDIDTAGMRLLTERSQDSLLVWYDMPPDRTAQAWRLLAGERDTVAIKPLARADFLQKHRLLIADGVPVAVGKRKSVPTPGTPQPGGAPAIKTEVQNPTRSARLNFNVPINNIDTSKWQVWTDSVTTTRNFRVYRDSMSPRTVVLDVPWVSNASYRLVVLPGGLTDFYGTVLQDSVLRAYNVMNEKNLGAVNLTLGQLVPGRAYVLQLLAGSATIESERLFVASSTTYRAAFPSLAAGTYTARIIEDLNANGRWDTGDYYLHRQPERVFTKKLDALRPNFDLESDFDAIEDFGAKKSKSNTGLGPKGE
jgi:Bacterial Ig-like domain